jgi:hypothetical protein
VWVWQIGLALLSPRLFFLFFEAVLFVLVILWSGFFLGTQSGRRKHWPCYRQPPDITMLFYTCKRCHFVHERMLFLPGNNTISPRRYYRHD